MIAFQVQLDVKKVRVVLKRRKSDGPFYARWSWKNKDYFKATGQYLEAAARARAREMVDLVSRQLPAAQEGLNQLIEKYLAEKWPEGGHTSSSNKSRLKKFASIAPSDFAFLPRREASIKIQQYLSQQRLAAYSVKTDQTVLSGFCSWLEKHGLASWESNPASARYLHLPALKHEIEDPLAPELVDKLLAATTGHPFRPVILWGLVLGARPVEAARADWADIDLEQKIAKLFGKREERRVPIGDWGVKEFLKIPCRAGKIFPFNYYTIFDQMDALRVSKKLPPEVTLQALRRTAARRAASKISVFEYSDFFGHSLDVAKKHYIGWGLTIDRAAVSAAFDYSNPEQNPEQ